MTNTSLHTHIYTLYGNEMSFYTGKVRAYLNWKGLRYREVLPSRDVFKATLLPNVGRAVVPVLEFPDGRFIQDSADIITALEELHPEPAAMPVGPAQTLVSLLLELFADEWLIIPALHYRWQYNAEWSYLEFGKTALPNASAEEQFNTGQKNARFFENWLPEVGVTAATIPGVEKSYELLLNLLSKHFEQHDYVFGARPSHADFALYGPLYAHLYRDPESGKLMRKLAPPVCEWVERCKSGGTQAATLLSDDAIPETLEPILAMQMREQLPVLLRSGTLLDQWVEQADPHEIVPRGFGTTEITISDCSGTCLARSFPLFRLQAVLDHYQSMAPAAQNMVDELLVRTGGAALKSTQLNHRLQRSNNQLIIAR